MSEEKHTIAVVDLETLSTAPDALITAIGITIWEVDQYKATNTGNFEANINIEEYEESYGFHISPDTVAWWLRQSQEAQQASLGGDVHPALAIDAAREFLEERHFDTIWGNAPSFDLDILANGIDFFCGADKPWDFRSERCVRTACEAAGVRWKDYLPEDDAHKALADARAEAMGVAAAIQKTWKLRYG